MKIRGLLVAAIIFFILAGLLYWSEHRKPGDDTVKASADAPPAILKLDSSSITRLDIKEKDTAPVVLTKGQSGSGKSPSPSPSGRIKRQFRACSQPVGVESERMVEDKTADLKPYGLDRPGLEVDLTDKSNKTQKILIGDDTPTGSAVYVMLSGDPRVFTMPSYTKNSVDKSLNDLRDKRLLTVEPRQDQPN